MARRTVKLIVVLDASILISAALKQDSIPEHALLRAIDVGNRVILSQEVEDEYRAVLLRPKFNRFVSPERRERILDLLVFASERIEVTDPVRACSDPNDDKYLALAVAGGADVIISGDKRHLLPLHPWRGISILTPAAFLALA